MAYLSQGYVSLLNSQTGDSSFPGFVELSGSQSINLESPELPSLSSQSPEAVSTSRERRSWSVKEDVILISAWLNTSKDAVVGNEQRGGTFGKRIHDYFNSSVILAEFAPKELGQVRQRWGRINDLVSKFCGSYEAALREQSSGENDNDVLSKALEIYNNDYNCKYTLEHAWRELRYDQKWCTLYQGKGVSKEKRKGQSGVEGEGDLSGARPQGVKAAKAAKRKNKGDEDDSSSEIKSVLHLKERLNNQKLLEMLLQKPQPLSELEVALRDKLMTQML